MSLVYLIYPTNQYKTLIILMKIIFDAVNFYA